MKCKNCSANIPPEWVHCINTNVCPACGSDILSFQDLSVLAEIRDAMAKMPNNPEGIAGWLMTNYKLMKSSEKSPPITKFFQESKPQDIPATLPTSQVPMNPGQEKVNHFFARAGISTPSKEDLRSKINKPESTFSMILDSETETDSSDDEEYDEYSVEGTGDVMPTIFNQGGDPFQEINNKQKNSQQKIRLGGGPFRRK